MSDKASAVPDPTPTRIRRNTACTSCRDSKELEKEVLTIKNAVQNAPGLTPSPTPHGRLSGPASGPSPNLSPTTYSSLPERPRAPLPALPSPQNPEREARLAPATGAYLTPTSEPRQPTQPRALGSKVLPAEEVEYYFDQYFKHFHPYFPIVRIRKPNRVYAACPILFWTIITVACRAYACDAELFSFLAQNLPREVWAVAMTPPLDLPAINALLVLSAWRFPSAKNSGDPSSSYVAIAMNASLMPGLHTGRGAHRGIFKCLPSQDGN
ncbi:Cytosolic Fe-S cluster assembly factor nar-1 [Verticillium dahliae VDG2]|nr:Cytosolic Fe-S cluster assembly factor nar-1 [Verticillium dahliae VDG2]